MDKHIFVSYEPFSMQSRVEIRDGHKREYTRVHTNIEKLAEELVGLTYSNDTYNIKFHAPLAIVEEVKDSISECEQQIYSKNKITIEVI